LEKENSLNDSLFSQKLFNFQTFQNLDLMISIYEICISLYLPTDAGHCSVFTSPNNKNKIKNHCHGNSDDTVLFDENAFCSVAFEKLYNKALSCISC